MQSVRVALKASVPCTAPARRWMPRSATSTDSRAWHLPSCRQFVSSTYHLEQTIEKEKIEDSNQNGSKSLIRKTGRSPAAKASLRRVAQEAQQAQQHLQRHRGRGKKSTQESVRRDVTAYCAAEAYDMSKVSQVLLDAGYRLDPFNTNLSPHVVHFHWAPSEASEAHEREQGDVFILQSGTVVAWDVDEGYIKRLVTKTLPTAAEGSHADRLEMEDLEYYEDPDSENSQMTGDTIILGTRQPIKPVAPDDEQGFTGAPQSRAEAEEALLKKQHQTNLVLGKIAFSSGLARSTKVAVLESQLERYFESTRDIPGVLMSKPKLPYTRQFILRKTGQLLSMRAQLNLSSELTDSLPDLFWDSRYELGLEGYFVQVSRALDVGVRIRALNEKMNYAQEIASVLQDRLSEKHGLLLEWLIIALISIEVGFEILRLVKENVDRKDDDSLESLLKRYLEHAERERTP